MPFAREGSWSITMDWRVMTFVLVMVLIVTLLDTAFTKLVFAVLG